MINTQIIKLQNGEDLIANVDNLFISEHNADSHYVLEEPMAFHIDYRNNNSLVLQHYLPVQLVKENRIKIKEKDVLAIMDADEEFIEYYVHTIDRLKRLMKAKNEVQDMSDEELSNIINEFEIDNMDKGTLH